MSFITTSGGAIAAIVIVLLIFIAVGIGGAYFVYRRRHAIEAERGGAK